MNSKETSKPQYRRGSKRKRGTVAGGSFEVDCELTETKTIKTMIPVDKDYKADTGNENVTSVSAVTKNKSCNSSEERSSNTGTVNKLPYVVKTDGFEADCEDDENELSTVTDTQYNWSSKFSVQDTIAGQFPPHKTGSQEFELCSDALTMLTVTGSSYLSSRRDWLSGPKLSPLPLENIRRQIADSLGQSPVPSKQYLVRCGRCQRHFTSTYVIHSLTCPGWT